MGDILDYIVGCIRHRIVPREEEELMDLESIIDEVAEYI
jgi:hypothetical protein